MSHLFSKAVINDATRNITISDLELKIAILQWWLDMYDAGSLQKKSEKEFEGVYNESLFGTILGYTSIVSGEYTREKEPRNESNGQKPDIGLGFYSPTLATTQAVVELKDAATSLDRPQQRAGNMTPIQQAFKYKPLYNSKWVIVSNFFEIRLYTDTYKDYESFTLRELVNPADDYVLFRQFYAIFHASRLTSRSGESETEWLLARVRIEEEKISKEFYKQYKSLRLELMRDIWKNNPESQNAYVIEKSQRIIDRIVFICFCEDRGLIPQNELSYRVEQAKKFGFAPWEMLKKFFISIDSGDVSLGIPDGYNGGLFRPDASIDVLHISDSIIEQFVALGRYDFSEDGGQLSVEILGHIFEQSISDIEEIRSKIETSGKVDEEIITDKKVSKRKKDGIFYTPAYIVNYIVDNSLGKYLAGHEEALQDKYALKSDINEKNYRKREIEAYTEYQKILQQVKVLDPACGSGAFLVRVFDWLLAENQRVANILYTQWDQIRIWDSEDYFREILRNNIYGVDLNEESVEITKLSLWLKSAVKGKKLVTLDNNIKCGNSLIDDPAVAGDKAFDWNIEFADIMGSGWFDVIVGNPPYVQSRNIKLSVERNFLWKKYRTDTNHSDLYSFFIELSLTILNTKWILSFIIPTTILAIPSFKSIREYIVLNSHIQSIVTFNNIKVFDDATINPIIISICKNKIQKATDIYSYNHDIFFFNRIIPINTLSWDYAIDLDHSEKKSIIIDKVNTHELLDSMYNLIGWIRTGDDARFIGVNIDSSDSKKLIRWRDFSRYHSSWNGEYIWYRPDLMKEKQAAAPKESKLFEVNKKILIRMISGENFSATLDTQKMYLLQDNVILEKTPDMTLEYLLVLINSRIIQFLLTTSNIAVTQSMLWKLRIPKISLIEQKPFIERADRMLALYSELHDKSNSFLKNISTKYHIEKVTRKLEKWWELDFADFIKELKAKISLEEQEELMLYFDKRKTELRDIVARIDATDKEIDEMVFELYGLSEEDKRVVLEYNSK